MTATDPLTQLDTLDAALREGLRQLPSLLDTVNRRFRDAMPGPLGAVPLDQIYLDQAPLTHHLCARALGAPLAEGAVTRLTGSGFEPVSEQQAYWARRFLERTGPDLRQLHLDALKGFWIVGTVGSQRARVWLKQLYRSQLLAQARLRQADNTLSEAAAAWVTALASDNPAALPWQGAVVLHSRHGRQPLPGAFVLSRRDPSQHPDEAVLLITLTQGLEHFGSLAALHEELAERLEDDRQGPALLAPMDPERREVALRCEALTVAPFTGDLFDALQASLEQRQLAAVAQAWAGTETQTHLELRDLDAASDTLADAARLYELVSSQGPRLTRYMLLLERDMPGWMAPLGHMQRLELILGMRELGLATANAIAPGLPQVQSFADPKWLRSYAQGELLTRLRNLGIRLAPERILITVTEGQPTGPLLHPLQPALSVPGRVIGQAGPTVTLTTTTRSLVQLATENISPLDWDYLLTARVRDAEGHPIPGLTPGKVRKLVRETNVGGSYGRYLLGRLRNGPEAQWRRERHARLLKAKMHLEALKARHRGQLGPGGRGWEWVSEVLAAPSPGKRKPLNGQAIGVWQLVIRRTPLDAVYLFGPSGPGDAQPVVLYTPESPDRTSWRWFADRRTLTREWLSNPAFKAYILKRVALAERTAIGKLIGSQALASMVSARLIKNDFFDNAYRSETRLVMANADAQSASNREVNLQTIAEVAVTLTEVMCMVLPGRVTGVLALSRSIWAFLQAYLAIGEESATVVLLHAFDGYANLFEASVALSASPLFGKLARRVPLGAPVPLQSHYTVPVKRTFLRYQLATDYAEGVYEAQWVEGGASHYFIADRDGKQYEVLNDGEHWRVVDPRMPQALYKPIVRRNLAGEWEIVGEIQWRGPVPDIPALLARVRLAEPPPAVPLGLPALIGGEHYLRLGSSVINVRPGLRPGRYTVVIPPAQRPEATLTVILRRTAAHSWEAKVRQSELTSEWFALPLS